MSAGSLASFPRRREPPTSRTREHAARAYPTLINPGTVLRLRLGLQAARLGPWPRLAGGRHLRGARGHRLGQSLAHRRLAVEQVLDLVARQRLVLEQALGEHFEVGALLLQDVARLGIALLDQPLDLGVDLLDGRFRDVLLARNRIAEEHLYGENQEEGLLGRFRGALL